MVSAFVLVVAIVAFANLAYQTVPVSQVTVLTTSYTTQAVILSQFVTSTYEAGPMIYSLPSPMHMEPFPAFNSVWASDDFTLKSNTLYLVDVTSTPPLKSLPFDQKGAALLPLKCELQYDSSGHGHGTLRVSNSGIYSISLISDVSMTISSLTISEGIPVNYDITQTLTTHHTMTPSSTTTATSTVVVPAYSSIGLTGASFGALSILMIGILALMTARYAMKSKPVHGLKQATISQFMSTRVEPTETKATSDKNLCIECGNELSSNLKFCESCGTKQ